jgi:hypothetical protein
VRKKNMPTSAVPVHKLIRYAPDRSRLRRSRTGSSGERLRASITPNAPSNTVAAASAATTSPIGTLTTSTHRQLA